jgi:hypothetical protein
MFFRNAITTSYRSEIDRKIDVLWVGLPYHQSMFHSDVKIAKRPEDVYSESMCASFGTFQLAFLRSRVYILERSRRNIRLRRDEVKWHLEEKPLKYRRNVGPRFTTSLVAPACRNRWFPW